MPNSPSLCFSPDDTILRKRRFVLAELDTDDEEQNFLEELIVKKFSNFSLEEPRTPENVKKIRKIPLEQLNTNKKNSNYYKNLNRDSICSVIKKLKF